MYSNSVLQILIILAMHPNPYPIKKKKKKKKKNLLSPENIAATLTTGSPAYFTKSNRGEPGGKSGIRNYANVTTYIATQAEPYKTVLRSTRVHGSSES